MAPPFRPVALSRRGFDGDGISADLAQLASLGLPPAGIAHVLRLLATERQLAQQASDRTELVWTGPETHSARSRDTSVVVRELFASAERSVLVSSYAVFQGRQVFHPLAARMAAIPALRVKLFLNVARAHGDVAPENQLLEAFADTFRAEHWPGARLPEVFYDPRSLVRGFGEKPCFTRRRSCGCSSTRWSRRALCDRCRSICSRRIQEPFVFGGGVTVSACTMNLHCHAQLAARDSLVAARPDRCHDRDETRNRASVAASAATPGGTNRWEGSMRRTALIVALLLCAGFQSTVQARGAKRFLKKESTVDMSAMKNVFLGWVDMSPDQWAVHGYASKREWESGIVRLNEAFQGLSQAKWLAGRTVTGAKSRDEAAAGQDLHVKFSDVRIDYDNYLLYLSIHFLDAKTNTEIASIPVRPYYGSDWGFERYVKAALEEVNLKIQVEVTGAAAGK